jgi:hypothetical protein
MTKAKFAVVLRQLADSVEAGDSMEGHLEYYISGRAGHDIDVHLTVRTGNLDGQGGYETIDERPVSDDH